MARVNGGDVEYNRGLFKGEAVLRGLFVGEGIEPRRSADIGSWLDIIIDIPKPTVSAGKQPSKARVHSPRKANSHAPLLDREPQIQQLELPIIAIEKVSSSGGVLAGAAHVLAQPVQRRTFFAVFFGVAVGFRDIAFERRYPVDLCCCLRDELATQRSAQECEAICMDEAVAVVVAASCGGGGGGWSCNYRRLL